MLKMFAGAHTNGKQSALAAAESGRAAPLVSMHDVSRHFDTVIAVDGVTFDVPPATILHIIGPSGSGKTTLVPILTGKLKPTAGSVQVLGEDPQRFRRNTPTSP